MILGVPIALLATIASLGVVVVDVREGGPDGHRIVVPVPLVFAQAALALAPVVAPADKLRIPDNEALRAHRPRPRGPRGARRGARTASWCGSRSGTSWS